MDHDQRLIEVKRRIAAIKGFYIHLLVFVMVMTMLLVVNLATPGVWWVQWVFLGWGIGVLAHALVFYGLGGWLGPEWEERKIRELMAKK